MSVEEMTELILPTKPKPKRKQQRRKPAAAAPAPKPASEFAGITVTDCPAACNADRCVISGMNVCAHPRKGGLHAKMQVPDIIRRFTEAARIIGKPGQ